MCTCSTQTAQDSWQAGARQCSADVSRVGCTCMRRPFAAHLSAACPQVTVWNDDIRIYKKELIKNMKKKNIL